ncbi:MAG: DinB family protein [Dehalococcoidia bacterium]|nr:DinB family protein [Dehalococcoidia bacterium]
MADSRIPDPTLMARLQLSVKGVDWAASLVQPWQHRQVEGAWSPHQHLFHLLAVEREVYQPRIQRMLTENAPVFQSWNENQVMAERHTPDRDIMDLAQEFMDERAKTVELLKDLTPGHWQRTATWPDGREVDLAWTAEKVLWHALDHFAALLNLHGQFDAQQSKRWLGQEPLA